MRCQLLDLDTGDTLGTAITERHPIPGMNVIDHVNYAMKAGEDVANGLIIETANNLFAQFDVDLSQVEIIAVCGNPFQLSLFQNIEIRDLAYAGKNMVKSLGVVSPPRDGDIVDATSLGLKGMPKARVVIPPAVTHEIGADAMAMMLMTNILEEKEPCIVVDYGTNAEMALVKDGNVYTGSAAAGPALEGQEIERGMLAAPGALSEIEITDKGWRCYVLDDTIAPIEGDLIDPLTGVGLSTYYNITGAEVYGLEFALAYKFTDTLTAKANYTYNHSEITGKASNLPYEFHKYDGLNGQPLVAMPKHLANLTLEWLPLENLSTFATLQYRGKEYYPNFGQGGSLNYTEDTTLTTDIGATWEPSKGLKLSAVVYNLFNDMRDKDDATYTYADSGRRFWFKISKTF